MYELQTTKKRQNKGFSLFFSLSMPLGNRFFCNQKIRKKEKKKKQRNLMRLTSENVGCGEFSQKLGSAKPSKKENLQ